MRASCGHDQWAYNHQIRVLCHGLPCLSWGIESLFVNKTLDKICHPLNENPFSIFIQCLDANDKIREERSKFKKLFRRRYLRGNERFKEIREGVVSLSRERHIDVIDTSELSYKNVLEEIDKNASLKVIKYE